MIRAGPVLTAQAQAVQIPPPEPQPQEFADEESEAENTLEWRVELSGIVTVKSDADDTAHATLSSSASFYRRAHGLSRSPWSGRAPRVQRSHTVRDSRSWLIRGGAGTRTLAGRWPVGYAPPESVDGPALLTRGFARGGTEARFTTPWGSLRVHDLQRPSFVLFNVHVSPKPMLRWRRRTTRRCRATFPAGRYLDVDEKGDRRGS